MNAHHTYTFAHKQSCLPQHQLVDRETNGGLAASDMRILQKTGRKLNVVGIGNHEFTGLDVATAACPFQSSSGNFVCIFHEYAYRDKGSSNHSPGQMEVFKTHVDDKSIKVGEQATEENRGKGTRLMNLKKRVPVVNSIVNYGGDKSTYLTTQEHLQHAWGITLQHPGQLGCHNNTVHKYNPSMLLTQVP